MPDWHSTRHVWSGPDALSSLYSSVEDGDIPFAQDVCGDQFLIRVGSVIRLSAETGDMAPLGMSWQEFLEAATAHPLEFLLLQPLIQYTSEGGKVEPGQLLSVLPPFCTADSAEGVSLKPIPALERIRFLADFAAQIRSVPEGANVRIVVE